MLGCIMIPRYFACFYLFDDYVVNAISKAITQPKRSEDSIKITALSLIWLLMYAPSVDVLVLASIYKADNFLACLSSS